MKRIKKFIIVAIITNLIFVFLIIYKQSLLTKLSYEQQGLENVRQELRQEKEALIQELYRLRNPKKIKDYAINKLGMKKLGLKQAKKIDRETGKINEEEEA